MNTLSTLGFMGLGSGALFTLLQVVACIAVFAVVALPLTQSERLGLTPNDFMVNGELSADAFSQQIKELESTVNAMLEGMPPVEQFENAPELVYALRTLKQNAANFMTLSKNLAAKAGEFIDKAKASAELKAETALIAKGEYVKKTDAQAAQDSAVNAAKDQIKKDLEAEQTATAEGEARRKKLIDDKVVTATVAAAIPADFFKADGFEDRKAKLTARLAKLVEAKLTAEEFVSEMVALPLDENGDKTFDARLASTKSLVTATASRPAGGLSLAGVSAKKDEALPEVAFF